MAHREDLHQSGITRRATLAALALVLPPGFATAQNAPQSIGARAERIVVSEFGQFERGPSGTLQHIERTTRIVARLGVTFGFTYTIEGPPSNLPANLVLLTRLPQRGGMLNPANGRPVFQLEDRFTGNIGASYTSGFTFDQNWEIVPGTWTLEIWSDNRKLGEQIFEIVRQ